MAISSAIRKYISSILEVLAMLLLLVAVIFFIINQQPALAARDRYCGVKASFGLYIIALFAQIVLLTLDCISYVIAAETAGVCSFDFYHLKVNLHFFSALAIFIGIIVESAGGAKEWQFYICLIAGIMTAINAIMWYMTQRRQRSKKMKKAIRDAENAGNNTSGVVAASAETLNISENNTEAIGGKVKAKAENAGKKVKAKAEKKVKDKALKAIVKTL